MVWLHGGGNDSGSSADHYYAGTALTRDSVVDAALPDRDYLMVLLATPDMLLVWPALL
jgi:hypothetical protein